MNERARFPARKRVPSKDPDFVDEAHCSAQALPLGLFGHPNQKLTKQEMGLGMRYRIVPSEV